MSISRQNVRFAVAAALVAATFSVPASAGEAFDNVETYYVAKASPVLRTFAPPRRRAYVQRYDSYATTCINISCKGYILLGVGN